MYGSSLISKDNTDEQNRRIVSVTTALDDRKNSVLRMSVERHEITSQFRCQIIQECAKRILDTRGVPETFQAEYREILLGLQEAVNAQFASLVHALGTSEQRIRREVECMYASATNALAGELEEHPAHFRALQSVHGDRAAAILISPHVRRGGPLVRGGSVHGKRTRSASTDSALSDSTLPMQNSPLGLQVFEGPRSSSSAD